MSKSIKKKKSFNKLSLLPTIDGIDIRSVTDLCRHFDISDDFYNHFAERGWDILDIIIRSDEKVLYGFIVDTTTRFVLPTGESIFQASYIMEDSKRFWFTSKQILGLEPLPLYPTYEDSYIAKECKKVRRKLPKGKVIVEVGYDYWRSYAEFFNSLNIPTKFKPKGRPSKKLFESLYNFYKDGAIIENNVSTFVDVCKYFQMTPDSLWNDRVYYINLQEQVDTYNKFHEVAFKTGVSFFRCNDLFKAGNSVDDIIRIYKNGVRCRNRLYRDIVDLLTSMKIPISIFSEYAAKDKYLTVYDFLLRFPNLLEPSVRVDLKTMKIDLDGDYIYSCKITGLDDEHFLTAKYILNKKAKDIISEIS